MLDDQNHPMAFTRYMCLFSFLLLDDSDVVQVDNTEEVVVVEKGTNTQMGRCLSALLPPFHTAHEWLAREFSSQF